MEPRMTSPSGVAPSVVPAIHAIYKAIHSTGAPNAVLDLVHQRVSQINGCAPCVDSGARKMRKNGETDDRMFAIPVWRETPYFTEPERAALGLAEAATRIADNPDGVPDVLWADAAKQFTEEQLGGIILMIALTNFFNTVNVTTRQLAPQNW